MPIKATINATYRYRLLAWALLLCGFAAWFLYDGFVAWPREQQIAREYAQFSDQGRLDEWPQYAAQRGWPDGEDGKVGKPRTDTSIRVQRVIGLAILPFGLFFLVGLVRSFTAWIACDGQTLTTSSGLTAPLSEITRIDDTRWEDKGIAVVHYRAGNKEGRVVLDDWKYEREPMVRIYECVKGRGMMGG